MEGYIGEIRLFAGNFAPMNWAFCQGQLLNIAQYSALYAILGVQYGGNGQTNFALPDLQSRVVVGSGNGGGLTPRANGQKGGAETVALSIANLPTHNHPTQASNAMANQAAPGNTMFLASQDRNGTVKTYAAGPADSSLAPTGNSGSNQVHENMPPWCGMNYIICLNGIFPTRD